MRTDRFHARVHSPRGGTRVDRGETTTQLVLLVPAMLLVLLLAVQAAVWFHAANVATAAASQGAAAASVRGANPGVGAARAQQTAVDLRAQLAASPTVTSDGERVVVTVRVQVPAVVPFFSSTVRRTASEPIERFVPEAQR